MGICEISLPARKVRALPAPIETFYSAALLLKALTISTALSRSTTIAIFVTGVQNTNQAAASDTLDCQFVVISFYHNFSA
jgi:hypothetical protein